jgi:hypothetical protein
LASISDARRLLGESAEAGATSQLAPALPSRLGKLPWIAAAALAIGFAASSWIAYSATRPADLKPLVRLDLDLDPPVATVMGSGPILSPDGSRIVYRVGI